MKDELIIKLIKEYRETSMSLWISMSDKAETYEAVADRLQKLLDAKQPSNACMRITEDMEIQKEWYQAAGHMTRSDLMPFINHLVDDYHHDYGTICHAMASGALAAMWAINASPQGGVTGFQASCALWEVIKQWSYPENKCGLRMMDYDNLLYPQYQGKFTTLSQATWIALQAQASSLIAEADREAMEFDLKLQMYLSALNDFLETHPDYKTNNEYYNDKFRAALKDESTAVGDSDCPPIPPTKFLTKGNRVYNHWLDIVAGKVPSGFTL